MNRLYKEYKNEIVSKLMKELKLSNVMLVPKLKKIVVNSGIGAFRDDKEALASFKEELGNITGQKPAERKARLSEAGFKVRKGDLIGLTVTLRGNGMWAFFDKLVNVVFPRVRDFRGVSVESFDDNGNYSVGIREHIVFPEVNANTVKGTRSLEVSLVMDSKNKEYNKALLTKLGMPFRKENNG